MLTQEAARKVMGLHFFGSLESQNLLGIESAELPIIPYPEELLRESENTHVLAGSVSASLEDLLGRHPGFFEPSNDYNAFEAFLRNAEPFMREYPEPAWRLIPRNQGQGASYWPKPAVYTHQDGSEQSLSLHDFVVAHLFVAALSKDWVTKEFLAKPDCHLGFQEKFNGIGEVGRYSSNGNPGPLFNSGILCRYDREHDYLCGRVYGPPTPF
jgi:hypothetical protein